MVRSTGRGFPVSPVEPGRRNAHFLIFYDWKCYCVALTSIAVAHSGDHLQGRS